MILRRKGRRSSIRITVLLITAIASLVFLSTGLVLYFSSKVAIKKTRFATTSSRSNRSSATFPIWSHVARSIRRTVLN